MKFKLMMLPVVLVIGLLSGCSSMFSNEARCPFTEKGGCQSVSSVNKMISEGKFSDNGQFVQQANQSQISSDNTPKAINKHSGDWRGLNTPTPYSGQPLRTKEVDARMWVAPWQDSENNYHGSSYITFVVENSHWSNLPAKEITENNYDDQE